MNAPVDLRMAPAAGGTWLVCYVGITHPEALVPFMGALGTLGAGLAWWPRRRARHRTSWRGWVSLTILFGVITAGGAAGVTALQVSHRQQSIDAIMSLGPGADIQLRLTSDVKETAAGLGAHGVIVSVRGARHHVRASLPVYAIGVEEDWRAGMILSLEGTISPGPQHSAFLRIRSVHAESPPAGIHRLVDQLREGVRTASNGLPPHARGLLPGVAIGDDRRLPEHDQEAMRTTSLTHITAVSGAHVAIVLGTVMFVLGPVPRALKATVATLVLGAMVIVVLPTPSVLRAGGMGVLTIIALGSKRPRLALPVLFFTVIVLLVRDPWLATSIGFALSVSATMGIVLMSEPLARSAGGGSAARALAVPTAAQLWCAPLLLTFDASIATYAVPANLLALPALAPATITALASALLSTLTPVGAARIASLGRYFTAWIVTVAQFFAGLPGSRLPWISGPFGVVLLILVSAAGVWGLRLLLRGRTWQA